MGPGTTPTPRSATFGATLNYIDRNLDNFRYPPTISHEGFTTFSELMEPMHKTGARILLRIVRFLAGEELMKWVRQFLNEVKPTPRRRLTVGY